MDMAYALSRSVREWTGRRCPDEPRVVEMAVSMALHNYADGASVAEAYERARAFVASWAHHPANVGDRQIASLPAASQSSSNVVFMQW